jgi:hypothetical protein
MLLHKLYLPQETAPRQDLVYRIVSVCPQWKVIESGHTLTHIYAHYVYLLCYELRGMRVISYDIQRMKIPL